MNILPFQIGTLAPQKYQDRFRLQSLYARLEWAKGMKATFWSRHGIPSVIVNGETDSELILDFAIGKDAFREIYDEWHPDWHFLFCVEFDPMVGPEMLTLNEIDRRCEAMRESGSTA